MTFTQADWPTCLTDDCERKVLSAEGICKPHHADPEQFVRACSLPECSTKCHQSGYCIKHWTRLRKHGDPRAMSPKMVDWSVPQFCVVCKEEMRKSNTPDDGTGRRQRRAGGLCSQCEGREVLRAKGAVSRLAVFDTVGQNCRLCKTHFPFSEYRKATDLVSGHVTACKVCEKVYMYGLNRTTYMALLVEQKYGCAVCSRPIAPAASGATRSAAAHVDHNHACCGAGAKACVECVRGLLGLGCNSGLGNFRDNASLLRNAAAYLRLCAERGPLQVERFVASPKRGRGTLLHDVSGQQCGECERYQPFTEFRPTERNTTGHLGTCKTCEYVNRRGITRAGFEALLLAQGNQCPACQLPLTMGTATRYARGLNLDHDHKCCSKNTKGCCLRGALHATCNIGLGALGDDPGTLELAASYLERHNL